MDEETGFSDSGEKRSGDLLAFYAPATAYGLRLASPGAALEQIDLTKHFQRVNKIIQAGFLTNKHTCLTPNKLKWPLLG